jgi:autotransporter-associated beta strand protein
LTLPNNITCSYTAGGGATSFAASGSNLADNTVARTVNLSGGILTIASPALGAAGVSNFSEYGTTVNGYQDSFEGTSLGAGWNLSDGLNASVSGGKVTLTFGSITTQPFSWTHNSLLYALGSTNTTQTVLAKVRFNTVGTTDYTGRAGVTACTPVNDNGIRFLARNGGAGGNNNLQYLNEGVVWSGTSANGIWSSGKDYWMRLTYYPVASGSNTAGSMVGKLWLADGTATEPTSAVATTDRYYGTWNNTTIRNGHAGLSIGTGDNMTVDYVLIENSGLPSISNVGVGVTNPLNLPNTNIAATTAASELALPTGANTLGTLSVSGAGTLKVSGATSVAFGAADVGTGSTLNINGIGTTLATLTGGGGVTNNATAADRQLTVGGGTTPFPEFSGAITDGTSKISLVKVGGAALKLSGASTYTGTTTVTAGTLLVNSPGSLVSPVSVSSSTTFGGTGTVGGVTVNSGGHIAPGGSIGMLTLTGNLSLLSGARLDFELGTPALSDKISMPSSTLTLNGQDFSTIGFSPQAGFGPGTYTLIDAGNIAGTGLGGTKVSTINGLTATLAIGGSDGKDLVLTVVPEPSTIALLACGAVGLLGYALRKRSSAP